MRKLLLLSMAGLVGLATTAAASGGGSDFGTWRDRQLKEHSESLFGVKRPLKESSTESVDQATAEADPASLATVARGLHVRVVTSDPDLGANIDMIALWPNDSHPSHLIVCNEIDDPSLPRSPARPALRRQRRDDPHRHRRLRPRAAHALGHDPGGRGERLVRAGDRDHQAAGDDGRRLRPRGRDGQRRHRRRQRGQPGARWAASRSRGSPLYPNGVLYYGDENRPSTGTPGGAYFKFIPTTPWPGGTISNLSQSPLTAGTIYGLRLGKRSGNTDYGQGSNTGLGTWVPRSRRPRTRAWARTSGPRRRR